MSRLALCSLVLFAASSALPMGLKGRPRPLMAPTLDSHPQARSSLLVAKAAAAKQPQSGAGAASSVVSMAKNIVGSGVLALSAGVAAFSSRKIALLPASALLLVLGAVSAYSFSLIARVGDAVGAETYTEVWTAVFGEKLAAIPSSIITFMTASAAIAYSIIMGDLLASVSTLAGLPALLQRSNPWICLLSPFVLLPLSLMKDLSALAVGSLIGTCGTLYTALFMSLRAIDGTYAPGGKFYALLEPSMRPAFAAAAGGGASAPPLINLSIFVLVSMLASAYVAHYNAPKFYAELAPPADGSSKLPRFNAVVLAGFVLAATLSGVIMSAGYLTFGSAANGLILNNYATSDVLALVARAGIAASVLFSYPINFLPLRSGLLSLVGMSKQADKRAVHVGSTLSILALMSGISLVVKDLGLVVAVGGAILGSAVVYILPSLMFIANEKKKALTKAPTRFARIEVLANKAMVLLGVFFAAVGTVMSLK